jgi:uncharacterized protein
VRSKIEPIVVDGACTVSSVEPRVIDAGRFAREHWRASGVVALAQLPRLHDILFDREGAVSYAVEGYMSAEGRPALRISLTAELALRCQRCLERLPLRLDVQRDLVLVPEASELDALEDEDDDTDAIPGVGPLDLHDLLEQEIVLSAPMAPRHPGDACGLLPVTASVGDASPRFAALAGLKTQPR